MHATTARACGKRIELGQLRTSSASPGNAGLIQLSASTRAALAHLAVKPAARYVLHEAVDEEEWPFGVARHQRIGGEIIVGVAQVLAFSARYRHIEQRFRDLFGREPSEPLQ